MSIRDLRYVVTLADTLHFGRAAQRCHVSQPTLSAQVRKIEDYLGVPIFDRNHHRVEITPAGRDLIRLARIAVRAFDRMRDIARAEAQAERVASLPDDDDGGDELPASRRSAA